MNTVQGFELQGDTAQSASVTCDFWDSGHGKYRCNTIDDDVLCTTGPDLHIPIAYCNSERTPVELTQCKSNFLEHWDQKQAPKTCLHLHPVKPCVATLLEIKFLYYRVQIYFVTKEVLRTQNRL